jgi:hypothetical protein
MKRNTSRKTDRKTVAAQKNNKNRKGLTTGVKAGRWPLFIPVSFAGPGGN